ncbi:unnamed protein product [Bursaphelenchus xylophilus]|uniref:(pine wood nematode) hypothetical protein n=1 Tax=Bursaphelenchus xylophilus TaxID=6326 RepID=A0A1I7S656_BURXY|nr:unnamed protein product [Bursaphelenchus xylophilus]CAG9082227.1 unnamed protein product [Bursaphelenchus xylophilus]
MESTAKRKCRTATVEPKWGKRPKNSEIAESTPEKTQINGKKSRRIGNRSIYLSFFESGICTLCGREVKSLTASMAQRHLRRNHASALAEPQKTPGFDLATFLETLQSEEIASDLEESERLPASSPSSVSPPVPEPLFIALRSLSRQLDLGQENGEKQEIMSGIDERNEDVKAGRSLVVELMNKFYDLGWVFGSGGAMCLRNSPEDIIFVTPSAVQKDRLGEEDIGVVSPEGEVLLAPASPNVISSCFKLFSTIFLTHETHHTRNYLNSVIHSHSVESNLISSFPTERPYTAVRFDTEEMLKGIINRQTGRPYTNTEECVIPIIENAPSEGAPEFSIRIREAMTAYPECSAVLVRNHGAFYFGRDWKETKIMAEIFEYLFKLSLEKIKFAPHLKNSIFVN